MPIERPNDPRSALVREKYFSLHPKPLERWLWQQGLPQAAERVFWLHWEEGMRSQDWCSEIPIKQVARECGIDPSTVTRAYQVLKAKGLIRRQDPGRDAANPFQQATAITEVRLPRDFVTELSRSPNRPAIRAAKLESLAAATPKPASTPDLPISARRCPTRQETQALWGRASDAERNRFFVASKDRLASMAFDSNTRLTAQDQVQVLAQLEQLAIARPAPPAPRVSAPVAKTTPRRLSLLDAARLRSKIIEHEASPEVLRQVIWAIEEGALIRFPTALAINIALKKIREGAWTKPHRLPPSWSTFSIARRAVPETCSAA